MASLVDHLRAEGFEEDLIREAESAGPDLLSRLWSVKGVDPERLVASLGRFFDLPAAPVLEDELPPETIKDIPLAYFKNHRASPLRLDQGTLTLALADPRDPALLNDLRIVLGVSDIQVVVAPPAEIVAALNRLYAKQDAAAGAAIEEINEEATGFSLAELDQAVDLMEATTDAPVVKLVNSLLVEAIKRRSSDIHIEPYRDTLKVRYRVDGLLYDVHTPPRRLAAAISSRIKVMADLDIAERRLPQDGRFQIRVADQEIDVRVSVLPTAFGERIVMRLLNKNISLFTLPQLGLGEATEARLKRLITSTSGIILVTGPTGSGKTTTLYAALTTINTPEKNILTVEDPIEYQIPGLGQMQINPAIGLTFAKALRSILRHDPDVLMVGEIRDIETAQISIHASQTGHLVLSTLHTNDAAGAVTRLIDMGIEPFLIASSLSGVLAQRLVRRVCPRCRRPAEYPESVLAELGLSPEQGPFYKGGGCPVCFDSGFSGRLGVFELLTISEPVRRLILNRASSGEIAAQARELGLTTLLSDGAAKVKAGLTTPEEVLRVVRA